MTEDKQSISVVAAARKLGLSPRTVRDLIREQRLTAEPKNPHAKRKHWLVSIASIEAFIEARRKLFASGRSRRSGLSRLQGA